MSCPAADRLSSSFGITLLLNLRRASVASKKAGLVKRVDRRARHVVPLHSLGHRNLPNSRAIFGEIVRNAG